MAIVALGGLEGCDGAHWMIVMKKLRSRPERTLGRAASEISASALSQQSPIRKTKPNFARWAF